jgi:hypothetical protein
VLVVAGAYGLLRFKRSELVDFVVPRTAAVRFLAHEPLYRPEMAITSTNISGVRGRHGALHVGVQGSGTGTWFTLTWAMAVAFVRLSLFALPDRRLSSRVLMWLTAFLCGKFLVKELAFGQFNLPVGLLMIGCGDRRAAGRGFTAGAAVAAGVFVEAVCPRVGPVAGPNVRMASVCPVHSGRGSRPHPAGRCLRLGRQRDVVTRVVSNRDRTTRPNLLVADNVSFASMWAKWIGPGVLASNLALGSAVIAMAAGGIVMLRRRHVAEPNFLEASYFCVLITLLSPQGWDYTLCLGCPGTCCLSTDGASCQHSGVRSR